MPKSSIVDSLMPREPDIKRLIEADFGDEADMASYTDELPDTASHAQTPLPGTQVSARER